jgi:hypothetical protein
MDCRASLAMTDFFLIPNVWLFLVPHLGDKIEILGKIFIG